MDHIEEKANSIKSQGNKFYTNKDYDNAIKCYEESLSITKDQKTKFNIYNNLSQVYYKQDQYDKALNFAFKSLDINPKEDNNKAFCRLSQAYAGKKQYVLAYQFIDFLDDEKIKKKILENLNQSVQNLTNQCLEQEFNLITDFLSINEGIDYEESEQNKILKLYDNYKEQYKNFKKFDLNSCKNILKQCQLVKQNQELSHIQIQILEEMINHLPNIHKDFLYYLNEGLQLIHPRKQKSKYLDFLEKRGDYYHSKKQFMLARQDYLFVNKIRESRQIKERLKEIQGYIKQQQESDIKKQQADMQIEDSEEQTIKKTSQNNENTQQQQEQKQKNSKYQAPCQFKDCQQVVNQFCGDCDQPLQNMYESKKTKDYCPLCFEFLKKFNPKVGLVHSTMCSKDSKQMYYKCMNCNKFQCSPHNEQTVQEKIEKQIFSQQLENTNNIDKYLQLFDYALELKNSDIDKFLEQKILSVKIQMLVLQNYAGVANNVFNENEEKLFNVTVKNYLKAILDFYQNQDNKMENYQQFIKSRNIYEKHNKIDICGDLIFNLISTSMQINPEFLKKNKELIKSQKQLINYLNYMHEENPQLIVDVFSLKFANGQSYPPDEDIIKHLKMIIQEDKVLDQNLIILLYKFSKRFVNNHKQLITCINLALKSDIMKFEECVKNMDEDDKQLINDLDEILQAKN